MFLQKLNNYIKNINLKIPELIKIIFIIVFLYNIPYFIIYMVYKYYKNSESVSIYGFFILMLLIYTIITIVRFFVILLMAFVTRNSKNLIIKYLKEKNVHIFILFIIADFLLYNFIIQPHSIWSILKSNIIMHILLNSLSVTYLPFFLIYGSLNLLSRKTKINRTQRP